MELFTLLSAGNVICFGYTGFQEYASLFFWIGGEVSEEKVEERGQHYCFVCISDENEGSRVVLKAKA